MKWIWFVLATTTLGSCSGSQPLININDIQLNTKEGFVFIDCESGLRLEYSEVVNKIVNHDIVLLGEQHNHATGHALQKKLVSDVFRQFPKSILALEMLERDEQPLVEDLLDGLISENTFATLTHSANWAGKDTWENWYQPIINVVMEGGGRVVAANAPRRYVKLARKDGYESLEQLPKNRRVLVNYPKNPSSGEYARLFWEIAGVHKGVATKEEDKEVLSFFRGQQVWDATMAESIVRAQPTKTQKVILLTGQFHVEYDGGIVQELRVRKPEAKVIVITIHPTEPTLLSTELKIADILVFEETIK